MTRHDPGGCEVVQGQRADTASGGSAAIYEGASRTQAARIGGVTLQIVGNWVVKFNAVGPSGLIDRKPPGQPARLVDIHHTALIKMIEQGPDPQVHGVVRWRLIDLTRRLEEDFQLEVSKQTLSRELRRLGYRKLSARPRHRAQDPAAQEAFKTYGPPVRKGFVSAGLSSLHKRIRPSRRGWPRWRSARPGPHKGVGVERHFSAKIVPLGVV